MVESNHIHILNSTFQNGTGDYIIIDESSDVLINRCAFLNISTEWKSAIYVKYSENIEIIENWFFDMFMGYRDTGEGEEEYTTGNVSLNYYGFIQDCFFDNETLDHLEDIDNINTTIFDRNAFGSIVYTNEMLVFTGTQTDEGGDTGTSENTDDGDSDPTDNTGDTGNQDDDPSGLSPGIIALIVIVSIVVVSTGVFFLLKKKHILSEKSSKE